MRTSGKVCPGAWQSVIHPTMSHRNLQLALESEQHMTEQLPGSVWEAPHTCAEPSLLNHQPLLLLPFWGHQCEQLSRCHHVYLCWVSPQQNAPVVQHQDSQRQNYHHHQQQGKVSEICCCAVTPFSGWPPAELQNLLPGLWPSLCVWRWPCCWNSCTRSEAPSGQQPISQQAACSVLAGIGGLPVSTSMKRNNKHTPSQKK